MVNKVLQFLEGNLKMLGNGLNLLPRHLKEQVVYRSQVCKNDCMKQGQCIHCGCKVPGKLYVKKSCNKGVRFPDLMSPEAWETFKKNNNITINYF